MIIPKEELTTFQRWQAGSFDRKPPVAPVPAPAVAEPPPAVAVTEVEPQPALPTAEEIERIYEEARRSGYEAGLAEGRLAGEEAMQAAAAASAEHFATLVGNLEQALTEIDQSVAEQLLALALEIAAQIAQGSIAVKTDYLLPIIREAIKILPLHHAHIALRLHPSDAERVRRQMGEQFAQTGTQILEDETISPGGCLLRAGTSEVDATIETRWKRVLEAIGTGAKEWLAP